MKTSNLPEQDDLLIMPYLSESGLPSFIRDLMPLAKTSTQQDMLLLSILTASGAAMPNTYFTYGQMRRVYNPNLICFIEAMAAQGKSIASVGQQLLLPIDREQPLFLAGDSTHAAFVQHLSEQFGVGFCYESEGSVITDIWRRSGCNGYNSLLRKAAEHEEYRLSRKTQPDIVIPCPKLSMLITGTFDQFVSLVPSATNGLFSRIIPLVVRQNADYDPSLALTILPEDSPEDNIGIVVPKYANLLLHLYRALKQIEHPIRFSLTPEQAKTIGHTFYSDSLALMPRLGQNFHQSVARMTVHTLRIAHILTLLRFLNDDPACSKRLAEDFEICSRKGLFCSDQDFSTALLIGRKLLLHAADAFTQINADRSDAIPAARGSFQQTTLFSALPDEFSTDACLQLAADSGISERSVKRWLTQWTVEGVLARLSRGSYRKAF